MGSPREELTCVRKEASHMALIYPCKSGVGNSWVADLHREASSTAQPWGYLKRPPLELLKERGQEEQGRVSGSSV